MRRLLFIILAFLSLRTEVRTEVIDRLAITVGNKVITEQQVDEEIRVTAFLNREKMTRTEESRRQAADHLVEQLLVKREMELSHYPLPKDEDVNKYMEGVRTGLGAAAPFAPALAEYGLSESTLKEHLALQLTTLQFIEFRFKPNVDILDSDIEAAYKRESAHWQAIRPSTTPPSLSSSRESIRKALLDQRTDEVLNGWLEETRKQVSIVYLDKALR